MKENKMLGNIQAKIKRLENKLDERQKELSDLTWKYFIDESSELLENTSLESMQKRDHYKNALEFEIMRLKCKIKQLILDCADLKKNELMSDSISNLGNSDILLPWIKDYGVGIPVEPDKLAKKHPRTVLGCFFARTFQEQKRFEEAC